MNAVPPTRPFEPEYASRAAKMQASEIRELLKLLEMPGIISFAGGIPDPALFPLDEIRDAYQEVMARDDSAARALQYSVSEGDQGLRDWLVGHMAKIGVACARENILITNGSQQGLDFLGRLLLSPNDTALVAAPTYLGALQAFSSYEPVYDELKFGDTNRTVASYQQNAKKAGGVAKFAYIVPDFANPTGETLNLEQRKDLLDLARDLNVPIIEDNPYTALRYDGESIAAIQAVDIEACGSIEASRVIHCGSFSKVFTPGLRIGWICASSAIIARLTLIKQASDLNSSAINQQIALKLAETLYEKQVKKGAKHYKAKRDAMLRALDTHMPKGTSWTRPEGGFFVWLTLPAEMDAAKLLEASVREAKVAFVPGHAFFADGSGKNTMRLSFSLPDVETIEKGIEKLAALIARESAS